MYEYVLNLFDGNDGFIKNEFLVSNFFEESFEVHDNAKSALITTIIRNKLFVFCTKKYNIKPYCRDRRYIKK
ncbi:hypothetical protein [Candidatus Ruthturnera calyptogenae]|uniref:hypothetical protein n=1 Tax=Candidatus Ruthturnera calyptogenae TaxID=386487 RepID=UPI0004659533|nr:hypothetical protein [Candidatus Ruthturnera calyptogenae]